MKLLWYWYVMRGAGSILETQGREASHADCQLGKKTLHFCDIEVHVCVQNGGVSV